MATMFHDELDRLRLQLRDTQENVSLAEQEKLRLVQDMKAAKLLAEQTAAQRDQIVSELEQQRQSLTTARRVAEQVPTLETQLRDERDSSKRESDRAGKLEIRLGTERAKRKDAEDTLSDAKAELANALGQLDPYRKLVAALKQRVQADAVIAAETRNLSE